MALWEFLGSGSGVTKGLYHLNGDANDSSWNWNNGTATNVSYVAGRLWSQCASFNGSSSKIVTGNCNYWTRLTVSVWLKPASSTQTLFARAVESNVSWGFAINTTAANNWVWSIASVNTVEIPIANNVWQHLVFTYDWAYNTLYNNWVQSTPRANTTDPTLTNAPIYIWEYVLWGNYYFNWLIDEVIIENRAWSAIEVKKQYTYQKWRFWIL